MTLHFSLVAVSMWMRNTAQRIDTDRVNSKKKKTHWLDWCVCNGCNGEFCKTRMKKDERGKKTFKRSMKVICINKMKIPALELKSGLTTRKIKNCSLFVALDLCFSSLHLGNAYYRRMQQLCKRMWKWRANAKQQVWALSLAPAKIKTIALKIRALMKSVQKNRRILCISLLLYMVSQKHFVI